MALLRRSVTPAYFPRVGACGTLCPYMRPARGYILALVCDDTPRFFDAAALALARLQTELGSEVWRTLDLIYTPPLRLLCVLHLSPSHNDEQVLQRIQEAADAGHLRVLDPTGKAPSERASALRDADRNLCVREVGITTIAPALESFRRYVPGPSHEVAAQPTEARGPLLSLYYRTGDRFLSRYARNSLFVDSEAVFEIGQYCRLAIATGTNQGPIVLSARVVHAVDTRTSGNHGVQSGFGVALLLPSEERDLFESFLIALERGTPWPDRSGRKHERFPIHLRVVYDYDNETRREYTDNLSRGGLFISSFDPPARGERLRLAVFAPGSAEAVEIAAEVTHVIGAGEAAARGVRCGAGTIFTEDSAQVRAKVGALLSTVGAAVTRRILIVDDDQFFLSVLGNAMRLGGFDVIEAVDGSSAAQLLLQEATVVDAVLVDLYMPGLSGAELLAQLRREPRLQHLPVVMVSGASLTDLDVASLTNLGADDVLTKSLAPEAVLERIEAAIAKRQEPAAV